MAKYFSRIFQRRSNLSAYSQIMQKEWRTCRKKFLLSTMLDEDKVTVFRENPMGDHKLA
jgi:hypothetical protein